MFPSHKVPVIEDTQRSSSGTVGVGTILLEARLSFIVPNESRSAKNISTARAAMIEHSAWRQKAASRQDRQFSAQRARRRQRHDDAVAAGLPLPDERVLERVYAPFDPDSDGVVSSDEEPEPAKPVFAEHAKVEKHTLDLLQSFFYNHPFEALQLLAGTLSPYGQHRAMESYLTEGSVQCFSPAGLTNVQPSRAFASVRALCQQKRAFVKPEAPDASLWAKLVRQPPRVLKTVWSFASLKKMPLSACSLAALEEEEADKAAAGKEGGGGGVSGGSGGSGGGDGNARHATPSTALQGASLEPAVAGAGAAASQLDTPEKVKDSPFVAFLKALILDAEKNKAIASFKSNKKLTQEWKKGGGSGAAADSEPNHLDPSQLSFTFDSAPLMVDPHRSLSGGGVSAVLTVRLAAGAFSVGQRRDKKLASLKQRDLQRRKRHQTAGYTTLDTWHDRGKSPIVELLGQVFPERWGVDEDSPVVRMCLKKRDI
jgi:hypothetical protein